MNIMDILSNTADKLTHFSGPFPSEKQAFTQMPPQAQGDPAMAQQAQQVDPNAAAAQQAQMGGQQMPADPNAAAGGQDVMTMPITNLTIGDLVTLIQQTVQESVGASAPAEEKKPTLEGLQEQINTIAGALGVGASPDGSGMMGADAGAGVPAGTGMEAGQAPTAGQAPAQPGMEVQASHTTAAQELSSILGL